MFTTASLTIVFGALSLFCITVHMVYRHKFLKSSPENKEKYRKRSMLWLGFTTGFSLCLIVASMSIDDRKKYHYPIVDRYDINGPYEYVEVWEDPKTECHYLIHKTRTSSSKMVLRMLENGKPDCPYNR